MARTKDAPGTTLPEIAWNILSKDQQEEVMVLRASCLYQVKELAERFHLPQKIFKEKFEQWLLASQANREIYRLGQAKQVLKGLNRSDEVKREINKRYYQNKKVKIVVEQNVV